MNDNIHFIHGSILDSQILDTVGYVDGIYYFEEITFCEDKKKLGKDNLLKFASSYRKPMKVTYCT